MSLDYTILNDEKMIIKLHNPKKNIKKFVGKIIRPIILQEI